MSLYILSILFKVTPGYFFHDIKGNFFSKPLNNFSYLNHLQSKFFPKSLLLSLKFHDLQCHTIRIGKEILTTDEWNYIAVKFEVLNYRGQVEPNFTQYKTVFESRGWKNNRWIDSYNMVIFPLHCYTRNQLENKNFRISMKYGTVINALITSATLGKN